MSIAPTTSPARASARRRIAPRVATVATLLAAVAALLAAVTLPSTLHAQGWVENPRVVRERTSVTVNVRNQVATVEVEEWFRNGGGDLGEADYLFPLPAGAVFSSYSLFQGDQELRGEMLDAGEARAIYERIVRSRRDPALIELVGHGLVRARVFPIAAGERRRIVLRYTQPLQRAGDALEFRYPANRNGPPAPVTITLVAENGAAYRNAVSATHDVEVKREGGRMIVRPRARERADFAVLLPYASRDVGIAVSTQRESSNEDGYFMLRLTPGDVSSAARVARDITVVVDVSGSMSGEKMEQAKAALHQLLGTLAPADRFRLIRFSSASHLWRDDWTRATPDGLRAATQWVNSLRADGGTNIGDALTDAFNTSSAHGRLAVVVFLTDGLPSTGEQNPEKLALIAERGADDARVFAFGVGHDVNTYLLDRLGAAGRGGAQYVQPGESVEAALSALADRIEFPVLTNVTLKATGIRLRDVQPHRLPDLFAREDLVVFGRYEGPAGTAAEAVIQVSGTRNGKVEQYSTRVTFARRAAGNEFIPKLWASRKLGELARQVRLNGAHPELVEEIRSTALRYGLLSEYTSYFVAEPGITIAADRNPLVPRNALSSRTAVTQSAGAAAAAPPPAARAATGSGAVAASEAARVRRETSSIAQLDAAEKAEQVRLQSGTAADARSMSTRVVAGRTFAQRAGVWEDAAIDPRVRVVAIAPYSDAYFALLRELPELRVYVTSLEQVTIAGGAVTLRFSEDAKTTSLTAAETAGIIREFRATS